MNSLLLSVGFADHEIQVASTLKLSHPRTSIEWLSKKTMSVTIVATDGKPARIAEDSEVDVTFLPECRKYRIENDTAFTEVRIDLKGAVSGWMDKVTNDFRYISMYSVWYPAYQGIDIGDASVRIRDCKDFDVLKARYDEKTREWLYGGNGYAPYEVVAFRKDCCSVIRNESASVYFTDPDERSAAQVIADAVRESLRFFDGGLFEKKAIGSYDVVSACGNIEFSGYARKELIVYDKFPTVPKDTEMCVAHEIAHAWCNGAETTTYEDWLNETTAEWSAILFGLSIGIDEEYILGPTMDRYERWAKDKPPIISDGTKRSVGGAQRGILMFGEIFKEYGKKKIEDLIALFIHLEQKNTDSYLSTLRETDPAIAASIGTWLRAEELPSAGTD